MPGSPRWWLRVELVAGLLVVAITAALVGQVPASSVARSASVAPAPTFDDRAPAGPFTVLVHVAPVRLGPEEITVRVVDSAGGAVTVEQVTGRLALPERDLGPFQVTFRPGARGAEFTGKALAVFPGRWELTLSVRLDALTDYVTLSSYDVR